MGRIGESAIITGGVRGIGKATALMFTREGADILVPDLDLAGSEETAREMIQAKQWINLNSASIAGRAGKPHILDYGASEFAVIGVT
jgi:NADP-dependent 3-hydroxy acid dehydrogenase YdfG